MENKKKFWPQSWWHFRSLLCSIPTGTTKKRNQSSTLCVMCTKLNEPVQTCHFQTSSTTRYSYSLWFIFLFSRSLFLCLCIRTHFQNSRPTVWVYCCAVNLNSENTYATIGIVTENKCILHRCMRAQHNAYHD